MPASVPPTKPRMGYSELRPRIEAAGLDLSAHPVFVAGLRGYYRDTMGAPHVNDRGIYDDAIFLVSPAHFSAYNANTDPSRIRRGQGTGAGKGMASLKTGLWLVYRFDIHGSRTDPHFALCQRAGEVVVLRDGTPDYEDRGYFGINIHRGGMRGTSSEGCQTIHPSQWQSFINSAVDQAKRFHGAKWQTTTLPYILLEQA